MAALGEGGSAPPPGAGRGIGAGEEQPEAAAAPAVETWGFDLLQAGGGGAAPQPAAPAAEASGTAWEPAAAGAPAAEEPWSFESLDAAVGLAAAPAVEGAQPPFGVSLINATMPAAAMPQPTPPGIVEGPLPSSFVLGPAAEAAAAAPAAAAIAPAAAAAAPAAEAVGEAEPQLTCWGLAETDLSGGDLYSSGNDSAGAADCCQQCWDFSGCGAWTFRASDVGVSLRGGEGKGRRGFLHGATAGRGSGPVMKSTCCLPAAIPLCARSCPSPQIHSPHS